MNPQIHGLPDLPPHHRLVTKGTPWHDRMLQAQCGWQKWDTCDDENELGIEYVYCEPTYPPIPEGWEIYPSDQPRIDGLKHWSGSTEWVESADGSHSLDRYAVYIHPIPKKLVPLGPEDFMPGPWWVRHINPVRRQGTCLIVAVDSYGANSFNGLVIGYPHLNADYERSNDGINWQPCSKEAV